MNKLVVGASGDFVIEIPELSVPVGNQKYTFLSATTINFNEQMMKYPVLKVIYDTYIIIISGIMVYCFYSYMWSFLDHIMGSRDVEAAYKIADDEYQEREREKNRRIIGFTYKGDGRK